MISLGPGRFSPSKTHDSHTFGVVRHFHTAAPSHGHQLPRKTTCIAQRRRARGRNARDWRSAAVLKMYSRSGAAFIWPLIVHGGDHGLAHGSWHRLPHNRSSLMALLIAYGAILLIMAHCSWRRSSLMAPLIAHRAAHCSWHHSLPMVPLIAHGAAHLS